MEEGKVFEWTGDVVILHHLAIQGQLSPVRHKVGWARARPVPGGCYAIHVKEPGRQTGSFFMADILRWRQTPCREWVI
jgi:hypothetical protein